MLIISTIVGLSVITIIAALLLLIMFICSLGCRIDDNRDADDRF